MFDIWTRDIDTPNKLDHMIGGFNTANEAMEWLITTYQADAGFWARLKEIKIIKY